MWAELGEVVAHTVSTRTEEEADSRDGLGDVRVVELVVLALWLVGLVEAEYLWFVPALVVVVWAAAVFAL